MSAISYKNFQTPLTVTKLPTSCHCCCLQSKSPASLRFHLSTFPATARVSSSTSSCCKIRAVHGGERAQASTSAWDEKPFEILPDGKKGYLDELDVVSFLNPRKDLIPLDPSSYNPAAYLWKKIGDIPEERRYRLLQLLDPRLISRAWEIAGTRYDDPKLVKKSASNFLSTKDGEISYEFYNCRSSGGPWPIAWMNFFKKTIFCGSNGKTYGRFIGGSIVAWFANNLSPLYFEVTQLKEVMSTEAPCDFAYEFGDGLLELHECPAGFPRPVKHPYPFSDLVVIYIRHIGPGVLVGQAWQEDIDYKQGTFVISNKSEASRSLTSTWIYIAECLAFVRMALPPPLPAQI
ncbi:hypothetical protein COLO4_22872 [Corchorus olitorius]|uniref:Uncharacterized protein n=1 Tax=Corchorus olitorius TaxID=93759 RepID=A0A1R3IJI5_9ROSI|nr:hypothetical protein COLO4_22872 [Corchorus olitorius]